MYKELKIGNYILSNNGDIITVTVDVLQKIQNDTEKYTFIPLTNDWVEKFKFDDSEYQDGYTGKEYQSNMILDFVLTKPYKLGEWQKNYVFELRHPHIKILEYVHELQNLFSILTENELTTDELK